MQATDLKKSHFQKYASCCATTAWRRTSLAGSQEGSCSLFFLLQPTTTQQDLIARWHAHGLMYPYTLHLIARLMKWHKWCYPPLAYRHGRNKILFPCCISISLCIPCPGKQLSKPLWPSQIWNQYAYKRVIHSSQRDYHQLMFLYIFLCKDARWLSDICMYNNYRSNIIQFLMWHILFLDQVCHLVP